MLERGLNNVKQNVKFYVTSIFSHVMEPFRPTGIANDDNSCYLNSVLQLLLSSACIRDRLSRLTEFDHGGVLISTVKEIFCQMLSTENFFINASTSKVKILQHLDLNYSFSYTYGHQHDASEEILSIINAFKSEGQWNFFEISYSDNFTSCLCNVSWRRTETTSAKLICERVSLTLLTSAVVNTFCLFYFFFLLYSTEHLNVIILFLQPFTISSSSVFGVSQISLDVCNKSVLSIADSLFAELYKSYKQESWTHVNGRSVKWISEVPYSYGSVRHPPNNSWSPQLLLLKTLLEKELKVSFKSVLINIYCSLEEVISQNTVITIR